jgi:hypothetical protein
MYMAEQFISSSFFRNLSSLAVIVGGVFYIEHHITEVIEENINPTKIEVKKHDEKINKLEIETNLSNYKWAIYENEIKDFLKPEEVKIKIRNGK